LIKELNAATSVLAGNLMGSLSLYLQDAFVSLFFTNELVELTSMYEVDIIL
jgi:hypothetical protein